MIDLRPHAAADGCGREAVGHQNVESDRLAAVEERGRPRFLGTVPHIGNIGQPNQPPLALCNHQTPELRRCIETALEPDRSLLELRVEPSNRRGQVLSLQSLYDIADADARRLQRRR